MKKIILLSLTLILFVVLTACESKVEKELKDDINDVLDSIEIETEVVRDFNLVTKRDNVEISWTSNSESISIGGQSAYVTRSKDDVEVTLTAIGKKENVTTTKEYFLVVLNDIKFEIIEALDSLIVPEKTSNDFVVFTSKDNVDIMWKSNKSNIQIIGNQATVTKDEVDVEVELTAVGIKENVSASKVFNVLVVTKDFSDAYDYEYEISIAPKLNASTTVSIDFWHTMGDANQVWLNKVIAEFNKTYPNIKVNHFAQGGYPDILNNIKKAISLNNYPDMAIAYPDHVGTYLGNDFDSSVVFNISALMKDSDFGINTNDYVQSYLDEGATYGTKSYYSMPFSKSTEALFYNVDFFKRNNLQVPKTWDELQTVMAKIKEIDSKITPIAFDSDANVFITGASQRGNAYTDNNAIDPYKFNNNENKAMVTEWKTWVDNGWLTTQALLDGAYSSSKFIAQEVVMTIGSTAGSIYHVPNSNDFQVGVAPIPQMTSDYSKGKVISQGPAITFFEDEKGDLTKTLAAWEFYKFLTNAENSASYALTLRGYSPVNINSFNDPAYKALLDKEDSEFGTTRSDRQAKLSRDVANMVNNTYIKNNMFLLSDVFQGSADVRNQMGMILLNSLSGKMTVDKAFDEAYKFLISN